MQLDKDSMRCWIVMYYWKELCQCAREGRLEEGKAVFDNLPRKDVPEKDTPEQESEVVKKQVTGFQGNWVPDGRQSIDVGVFWGHTRQSTGGDRGRKAEAGASISLFNWEDMDVIEQRSEMIPDISVGWGGGGCTHLCRYLVCAHVCMRMSKDNLRCWSSGTLHYFFFYWNSVSLSLVLGLPCRLEGLTRLAP